MRSRSALLAMAAAATSMIGGFAVSRAYAAGQPPVVTSGAITVGYEQSYSIHFAASDPDGDALTLESPPNNDDLVACDDGPASDFTCEYSSARYGDPAPLPTEPFQRVISYSVSDGTSTATGVWTVTVLPPPTMQIAGNPTVTEGGVAVLELQLSKNDYGSFIVMAHLEEEADDEGMGETNGEDDGPAFEIAVAEDATVVEVQVPIPDDAIRESTRHFSVVVDRADAIPFRYVAANRITVLDNDSGAPGDSTPPQIAPHRDLVVARAGQRPARVYYAPPSASDETDGPIPVACTPPPLSVMSPGATSVACAAVDAAGNASIGSFKVTVRRVFGGGGVIVPLGPHFDRDCVAPGRVVWLSAEGFAAGAAVSVSLLTSDSKLVPLPAAQADRKGRLHQFLTIPNAAAGDADLVVSGAAGASDLMRLLPLRIARVHHHRWHALVGMLRSRDCD